MSMAYRIIDQTPTRVTTYTAHRPTGSKTGYYISLSGIIEKLLKCLWMVGALYPQHC